jgi:hypothetical protein
MADARLSHDVNFACLGDVQLSKQAASAATVRREPAARRLNAVASARPIYRCRPGSLWCGGAARERVDGPSALTCHRLPLSGAYCSQARRTEMLSGQMLPQGTSHGADSPAHDPRVV